MTTGVIVGVEQAMNGEQAQELVNQLTARFPGVVFAVITGGKSIAFTFTPPSPMVAAVERLKQ